ncbi:MAG: hypothetical protein NT031_05780 [Planctomycetota bacterium]|nr:hypothetical protein [Planctomycetota bacterium]
MSEKPQPPFPDGVDPRDLTSFLKAGDAVTEFERILKSNGISIGKPTELETVCLTIMDMEKIRQGTSKIDDSQDLRPVLRRSLGLLELVKLVIAVHARGQLTPFLPHLHLLATSKTTVGAQNVREVSDQAANKLFELFIGLICLTVGSNVRMDDPNNAKGDNPDVLVSIKGNDWGFACKVINGKSPLTMYERLEEGVRQIKDSAAVRGCVIFNLRNVIDHDLTWPMLNDEEHRTNKAAPILGVRPNIGPVIDYLQNLGGMQHSQLEEANSRQKIDQIILGTKSIPGALLFLQTTTGVRTSVGPMATTVGIFTLMELAPVQEDDFEVLRLLNEAMHHRY